MQDEARIDALLIETKAGRQAVRAEIFIDCSGDGDLAAWAGAPFEIGDNAGGMLYPSMMFRSTASIPTAPARPGGPSRADGAGGSRRHAYVSRARARSCGRSARAIEWRVNFTQLARADGRAINGLEPDELTRGEIEGRRQAVAGVRIPAHRAGL